MALTRLPDAKERFALGQQCRKRMRRLEHKIWKGKDRRENPLKLLEASTKGRIPELVALKNELMAASPFAYFRGAVPVMAYDLSLIPNTGIHNQLCGDAHVRNLGTYAAQDGRLVFLLQQDVHGHDRDPTFRARRCVLACLGHRAGRQSEHARDAWTGDVAVQNADGEALAVQGHSQQGGDQRLAHAALPAHHSKEVLDVRAGPGGCLGGTRA